MNQTDKGMNTDKNKRIEARTEKTGSPKEHLFTICKTFLSKTNYERVEPEIEVRFGTRGGRPLNKTDFDKVVKKLKSMGFYTFTSEGSYSLKIENEFLDIATGLFKPSNIRVEIDGIPAIQEYCRYNDLQLLSQNSTFQSNITLRKKSPIFENNQKIPAANFEDFHFIVSYSGEEVVGKQTKLAKDIFDNWLKNKKSFRYINRISWFKEGFPFRIDLSIVKSSTKDKGRYIKTYTTSESNVFQNLESYEIEIELLNKDAKLIYRTAEDMSKGIEQITKTVLAGLQGTNYPISFKEQNEILKEYMEIIHGENVNPHKFIHPSDFIGPSSKTLQIKHIAPINPDTNIPNVRKDFVVTEKADGSRNLLFINKIGRIYLINTNMSVMFTGAKTKHTDSFQSILDGELIMHNKLGNYINLYAAFDIYYVKAKDVRHFPFVNTNSSENKVLTSRLTILNNLVSSLEAVSILERNHSSSSVVPIKITTKKFYPIGIEEPIESTRGKKEIIQEKEEESNGMDIFDACNYILRNVDDGLYEYNTDGLIFTHSSFGVGSNQKGKAGPKEKRTWDYSFKWKPSEFNTIDFLVSTKKGGNGEDIVTPVFENGLNTKLATQFTQYKTLILRCGFDESKHGYINPCQDLLEDKWNQLESGQKNNYRPVQFFPSNPYNPQAGLCNILLEEDENGNVQMFTEERQVFADNTIIEFRYDFSREGLWRWVPLRVRYDKTTEYRQGLKNYGNSYTVADDNWYSIHNPITKEMITTGEHIPDEIAEDDIYYNERTNSNDTKGLRDFHNLYVKKLLIQCVSKKGDTLIDYACGKGGDLPKWISAHLSFVFGIDISKDNLENRINGACSRFLNYKKEFRQMPYALFVHGNSSLPIRSGEALLSDKAIQITKAVFGQGPKDKMGSAVQRQYGKGENGFDISSCQFAIHYMFQNVSTLHGFLRNIAECTRLGGYFIGTSYDGKNVFQKLKSKSLGESIEIYENDKKIWQITKEYSEQVMEDTASCIGYKIAVYQESINKLIPEYLVNFDYFHQLMEAYGFSLLTREESKQLGLPESSGMFIELYNLLTNEIERGANKNEYGKALQMTNYEKEISFLNRYFVYKKIRTVNAEKLAETFLSVLPEEISFERKEAKEAAKPVKSKVKKLQRKLVLVGATDSNEAMPINSELNLDTNIPVAAPSKPKKKKAKIVFEVEK